MPPLWLGLGLLGAAGLVGLAGIWLTYRLDRLEVLTFRGPAPRTGRG